MSSLSTFGAFALLSSTIANGLQTYTETFRSPPIDLYTGQIINSDGATFELDWPRKPMAVSYFDSEVVDEDGVSVPLYDLYIHHYVIYDNLGKHSAGPCMYYNVWGIGAEMRGTIYEYPEPYAIVFDGTENITANLHFIRTEPFDTKLHQLCIECHCYDSTPQAPTGGIHCCDDKAYCWGAPMPNATSTQKTYYLEYTFKYTEVTNETKSIELFSYDVTAQDSFDCRVEYQIPESEVANGQVTTQRNVSKVLQDTDIVFVEIHQHVGGVEYSVEHYRNGTYIDTICTASPRYGNGTEVGNENGYVVAIPTCRFEDEPYKVLRGDELVLTSLYNARHIEGGYDFHEGVMGILFYWGQRMGPSLCEETLKTLCGNPLPASTEDCITCAEEHIEYLYFAECGGYYGTWTGLEFLCKTDNGVKTHYEGYEGKMDGLKIDKNDGKYKEVVKDVFGGKRKLGELRQRGMARVRDNMD